MRRRYRDQFEVIMVQLDGVNCKLNGLSLELAELTSIARSLKSITHRHFEHLADSQDYIKNMLDKRYPSEL